MSGLSSVRAACEYTLTQSPSGSRGTLTVHFERVFCPDAVLVCGLPCCHLNWCVWCSTVFCSETCNFWSFWGLVSVVPYSWMWSGLNHEILTFWVAALCVTQYHKTVLYKVFWKVIYVTTHKIIRSWCGGLLRFISQMLLGKFLCPEK